MFSGNDYQAAVIIYYLLLYFIAWGAGFLDGIGRRLQELENTMAGLADRFLYGTTAPESVAGGLANIRDMSK